MEEIPQLQPIDALYDSIRRGVLTKRHKEVLSESQISRLDTILNKPHEEISMASTKLVGIYDVDYALEILESGLGITTPEDF